MANQPSIPQRPPCRLYLITPPAIPDMAAFISTLAEALDAGDVAALQVRLKDAGDQEVLDAVAAIIEVTRARGVAVILNDRPDLAARSGCDGVHIGQSDMPLAEARRIMGRDAMIGVTCHDSRELAMDAADAGADYVAFGAFYPTTTKATAHCPDPEILTIWQETVEVPCVAIGGVTAENAGLLARAGADFVAVSSGVWDYADGAAVAVRTFNQVLAAES
ncbi:MAG: thiamine phosphate synthase [Alphaproteobacteria bacterium]|nr:MAG: thiamine phosphate synthase [Alphaproteobacteria bacterium]